MNKILFLLLFPSLIYAANLQPITLNNFTGGLNTRIDSGLLDDKDSQECSNVVFDDHYTLQSRKGYVLKGTLPVQGNVLSSYEFDQANGKKWYIVQCDSSIFATEDWLTWTPITLNALSTFYPCNYAVLNNNLFISNGIDYVCVWDGILLSTYTFIPRGRYIISDNNQLWIAGVAGTPSTVYFSRPDILPNLIDSWSQLNSIDVNIDDGDIITGIVIYQNKKVVFKKQQTYAITGNSLGDIYLRNYSNKIGCIDNNSIQLFKNYLLFLSKDGLRSFNGAGVDLVSEKIYNDLKNIQQINSGGLFEWRINTDADFTSGSFSGLDVINNSVQLSSINFTWNSDNQFQNYTSSYNVFVQNNVIYLSTSVSVQESTITYSGNITYGALGTEPQILNENYIFDSSTLTCCTIKMNTLYSYSGGRDKNIFNEASARWDYYSGTSDEVDLNINFSQQIIKHIDLIWDSKFPLTHYTDVQYRNSFNNYIDLGSQATRYSRTFKFPENSIHSGQYLFGNSPNALWQSYQFQILDTNLQNVIVLDDLNFYQVSFSPSYFINSLCDKIVIKLILAPPLAGRTQSSTINIFDLKVFGIGNQVSVNSTGTYTSSAYDTEYASPKWGQFQALISTQSDTNIQFWLETSTVSNFSVHSSSVQVFPGIQISTGINGIGALPNQRYVRWKALLTSPNQVNNPIIYSVTINALKNYGTYTSPIYNVRKVTNWWIFNVDDNNDNQNLNYFIRSASTYAGINSAIFQPINKNTIITISTSNIYVQWKSSFSTTDGLSSPILNSVGIGWFTGNKINSVASTVYNNRYYLAVSTSDNNNNVIYVLDNNNMFTKYYGLYPSSLLVDTNNNFFYLSSLDNNIYQMETGSSDNGNSINTNWISKDYDFGEHNVHFNQAIITGKSNDVTKSINFNYSPGFTDNWKTEQINFSSGTYSTFILNIPRDSAYYSYKFKINSNNANYSYDIRKIIFYFDSEDEIQPGIKR